MIEMVVWPIHAYAGGVIKSVEYNKILDLLEGYFEFVDVSSTPLPFQVEKPSILLLLAEGTATGGFPNSLSVFLSSDDVIYSEVAAATWLHIDYPEAKTLTIPIPKDYFVTWTIPYGFLKSAVLF